MCDSPVPKISELCGKEEFTLNLIRIQRNQMNCSDCTVQLTEQNGHVANYIFWPGRTGTIFIF